MIIVMSAQASEEPVQNVVARVKEIGLMPELSRGEERTLIGVIGGNAYAYREAFAHLPGIHEIIPITKPFKLASREFRQQDSIVDVGGVRIGGEPLVVMAGPCSVESEDQLLQTARDIAAKIADKGPIAIALAKRAVYRGLEMSPRAGNEAEMTYFGLAVGTEDRKEGTRAFLEKRRPKWQGK